MGCRAAQSADRPPGAHPARGASRRSVADVRQRGQRRHVQARPAQARWRHPAQARSSPRWYASARASARSRGLCLAEAPPTGRLRPSGSGAQVFDETVRAAASASRSPGRPARLRPVAGTAAAAAVRSIPTSVTNSLTTSAASRRPRRSSILESGTIAVPNLEQFTCRPRRSGVQSRRRTSTSGAPFMRRWRARSTPRCRGGGRELHLVQGAASTRKPRRCISSGAWSARRCRQTLAHASRSRNGSATPAAGGKADRARSADVEGTAASLGTNRAKRGRSGSNGLTTRMSRIMTGKATAADIWSLD